MSNSVASLRRVLIVDDDADICGLLVALLLDEGYSVGSAANGVQALEQLASTPADIILMDLNMPIMNGYQFLARRATDPALAKIPVVMMSASTMVGTRLGPAARAGVSVLVKPIDVSELLTELGRCFQTVTHGAEGNVGLLRPMPVQAQT